MCRSVCGDTASDALPHSLKSVDSLATLRFPPIGQSGTEVGTDLGVKEIPAGSELADEYLLVRAGGGDQSALGFLFRRYARMVRGIAYRVLRNPSEADDLLQDVFLLIQRLGVNFDASKGSARNWILQLTYRRALTRRRYLTSRHFYSNQELDELAARPASPNASTQFEDTMEGRFGKGDVEELFCELSEDQRQALILRFVEGYTLPEIAEKLGQSRANIKNHYFRGLEKLRKHLFSGKLAAKRAL